MRNQTKLKVRSLLMVVMVMMEITVPECWFGQTRHAPKNGSRTFFRMVGLSLSLCLLGYFARAAAVDFLYLPCCAVAVLLLLA